MVLYENALLIQGISLLPVFSEKQNQKQTNKRNYFLSGSFSGIAPGAKEENPQVPEKDLGSY